MTASPLSLPNVNMKLLHAFVLVAERRSFRGAAEISHRSQSAVSAQIRQLEEQLGVSLFHRTTRQVTLTPEGEELLRGARRALEEVTFSLRTILETVRLDRGRVAVGCSPIMAASSMPRILAAFEEDHPMVSVTIRELTSPHLLEAVRQREVDFAVGQLVPGQSDLDCEPIREDPLIALGLPDLLPGEGGTIGLAKLAALPLLLQSLDTAMRQLVEANSAGLKLRPKYECANPLTLMAMARAGLGVAILPLSMLGVVRAPWARSLRIVEPRLTRALGMIRLKGRRPAPAAARLAGLIRRMAPIGDPPLLEAGNGTQDETFIEAREEPCHDNKK